MKRIKKIPKFNNEDEERDFWANVEDATEYFDLDNPVTFDVSELKPSSESISIRVPYDLLSNLKIMANKRDVPYQSLMKVILADAVNKEAYLDRALSYGSYSGDPYADRSAGLVMDELPKKKKPKKKAVKAGKSSE